MTIDIPKPCQENWDEMELSMNGRYCSSCQREVIDFTEMSNQEIIAYFKNNKNFCGSFNSDQLNRNYYIGNNNYFYGVRRFAATIVAFLSLKYSSVFALNNKMETVQTTTDSRKLEEAPTMDTMDFRISGRVTVKDSSLLDNQPIHIKIAYTNIDIQPDAKGNYEIFMQKDSIKQYTIISFFHPNLKFETRTIHITNFPQILNIEMDRPPSGRIGGMPVRY